MKARLAWAACALFIAATLAVTAQPQATRAADPLLHDFENGCGPAKGDFVPDNSAVLRVLFGDFSALPELLVWAADQDAVSYFTPACNRHDRCYGTYGSNRLDCDLEMEPTLAEACYKAYLKPDFSWKNAFGLGTIWKAPQFLPCVGAATGMMASVSIGGFFLDPFEDAQEDARKAATCDGARQTSYGGIYLPGEAIKLGWQGGCSVVDLAYGDGRWAGTSRPFGNGQQIHWLDSAGAVHDKWSELWDAGYQLTNLEFGDGQWVAVVTGDSGIDSQYFASHESFGDLSAGIDYAWGQGMAITEIEQGNGTWVMFASTGTGITSQRWVREGETANDLMAVSRREWDAGYHLTKLEYDGEKWTTIFSQGMPWQANGLICGPTYHEVRVALDEAAARGQLLADLEYGNGSWCGVWYQPQGTPLPSTPPTPTAQVTIPAAPANLQATAADAYTIHLTWTDSSTDEDGFEITDSLTTQSLGSNSTSYDWSVSSPGTYKCFKVRSFNGAGQSDWTAGWACTTSATLPPTISPTAPPQLVDVPDLGGMSRQDARQAVESLGLRFAIAGYSDAGADWAGRVVDQDPMPYGSPVPVNSTIRVWLGADVTPGPVADLDIGPPPRYGSIDLSGAFGAALSKSMQSGGSVDVSYLSSMCDGPAVGFAGPERHYAVNWTAHGEGSLLRFYFTSSGDTTLVINDPHGTWYCNDDSYGTSNPTLDFSALGSGRYDIWVGSYTSGANPWGTLYITQSESDHP